MGHLRLGELPKSLRWKAVVALLEEAADHGDIVDQIAAATVQAAEGRLRELANDPSLTYCFWLLTRLTRAARDDDFLAQSAALGVPIEADDATLSFIARISEAARAQSREHPESGPFAELASLALRRSLSETAGQSQTSLFGSSVDDLQRAFRTRSTPGQFGVLAKQYFGDFLARTLRYFVDKELAHHVGPGRGLATMQESAAFSQALDTHARQSARIMEQFAGAWYSKHNRESAGAISQEEAQGFVAHALRKLRGELRRQAAAS